MLSLLLKYLKNQITKNNKAKMSQGTKKIPFQLSSIVKNARR